MCGIAGFLSTESLTETAIARDLPRMAHALAHRGPDADGFWYDTAAGVALCHRRLSILDLSPQGAQPMTAASGRYVMTFNGEIYNFRDLGRELASLGHEFRGTSDTEVLLAAIEQWGLTAAITRASGMFALAVWDRRDRILHLARDRFGEKPLYYARCHGAVIFGSELKALREHAAWQGDIDRDALSLLMRHDYIPAPHSIFRNVWKLRAGSIVSIRSRRTTFEIDEQRYWQPAELVDRAASHPFTPTAAVHAMEAVLPAAVQRQMTADVPLGAFLSGGVDSSLIVALMQQASTRPVKTFAIGFVEERFNEAPFARKIAAHLGTAHTELIVTPADALAVIPQLPHIYDEPLADASQIPTYLVSALARESVTVALSGDGGDELFGGYHRYAEALRTWQALDRIPTRARNTASALLSRIPLETLERVIRSTAITQRWRGKSYLADRVQDRLPRWQARNLPELYRALISHWQPPCNIVIGAADPATIANRATDWPQAIASDPLRHMMFVDANLYLSDDILAKVDRAAMAVSLETRVPLLDPAVARAAWQIPSAVHRTDGRGKWVLRQMLARRVPPALFERPKQGFALPLAEWLRGPLAPWAEELLAPERLRREGFFTPELVHRRWQQHRSGITSWSFHLWNVLTFQAWHEQWQRSATSPDRSSLAPPTRIATSCGTAPTS